MTTAHRFGGALLWFLSVAAAVVDIEMVCEISVVGMHLERTDMKWTMCHRGQGKPDLELDISQVPDLKPLTGDEIRVRGRPVLKGATAFLVSGFQVLKRALPPGRPGRERAVDGRRPAQAGPDAGRRLAPTTRTAGVLMIRFVDSAGNMVASSMDTVEERKAYAQTVNRTVFGDSAYAEQQSLGGLWKHCSYGKHLLGSNVDGKANDFSSDFPNDDSGADIFYVDVPEICDSATDTNCPSSGYDSSKATGSCSSAAFYGWPTYAFKVLAARDPTFSRYSWQHWIVIFANDAGACNFVGLGNVGCSSNYCYSWIPHNYASKAQDYSHELGHNLALAHAGVNGGSEYADYSCSMGYCCSTRCYSAPASYDLGWVTPSLALNSVNFPSGASLSGVVLKSQSLYEDGTISITTDWAATPEVFWLQLKTAHQYDAGMKATWLNNVQIKHFNNAAYEPTTHFATLIAGQSWTDPTAEFTVTVDSIDTTSQFQAILTITRAGTATTATPTAAPTPAPTTTAAPTPAPTTTAAPTPAPTTTAAPTPAPDLCAGVTCYAQDDCHDVGVCDSSTGICSNPLKADGATCSLSGSGPCDVTTCSAGTCMKTGTEESCCGNGVCEAGESCTSCGVDCPTFGGPVCGNGVCETADGEDCTTCPSDCNGVTNGKPSGRFCCGTTADCSDPRCSAGVTCSTSPASTACCGDGTCSGGLETSETCSVDCVRRLDAQDVVIGDWIFT